MPNYVQPLLFSEADKTSHSNFIKDATGIMWAYKNRTNRPERFGSTPEEVIFAPKQFSGVGGNEWNKVINNNLTEKEEWYAKKALQIQKGVEEGLIPDPTGGADHYVNPKLANPNWAKEYEKTYSSGAHNFHSELKITGKKSKRTESEKREFNKAFGAARKAGKEVFTWKGEKYTTELAK